MGFYWSLSDLLAMTQMGIVLFAGARFIQQGTLTVGELFAFTTYVAIVMWPVRQLGRVLTDSGKAVISLQRIHEILTETRRECRARPGSTVARPVTSQSSI